MFAQYLPEKYVEMLIADPNMLQLGGKRRRMSVLFTDIAGFTTVSERLSPEELIGLLNEYLTNLTRVILENDGIIDKYEGDLIMAEFGMPVWYEDHAERCCRASLRMQKRLVELRDKWKSEGKDELYSRVGVNTGDMAFGNMGSEEVFDYTVMGDTVNLASRFEGANKTYGSTIMIGKETYLDVKDKFVTRPLDSIQVKGKLKGVEVFELLAEDPSELSPGKLEAIRLYTIGLEHYRSRRFDEGAENFRQALENDPSDNPSKVFLERCRQYIETPPDDDWAGVWTLTEK
jgi:adenylate cyclase